MQHWYQWAGTDIGVLICRCNHRVVPFKSTARHTSRAQHRSFIAMANSSPSDWAKQVCSALYSFLECCHEVLDNREFAQDERRMLHAVYRVGNLDETIEYILNVPGVQARLQTPCKIGCCCGAGTIRSTLA